jgi:FkbM family methyltransferase
MKELFRVAAAKLLFAGLNSRRVQRGIWRHVHANGRASESLDEAAGFFAFALSERNSSSAQLHQDLWVLWESRFKRDGFFVEFGATNGRDLSNTYLLERNFGWRGILAEPFPHWHAALSANRTAVIDHRCVWQASRQQLSFVAVDAEPELAGLQAQAFDDRHAQVRRDSGHSISVTTVSLLDLLREHGAPKQIDYLSIDTEGSELSILSAFDFSQYRIQYLTVEHNGHAEKRAGIQKLLATNGFTRKFEQFSRFDDWYINESPL